MGNCVNGDSRRSSAEASILPSQQQCPPSRTTHSASASTSTSTSTRDTNANRDVPVSQSAHPVGGGGSRAPSHGSQATLHLRQPLPQRVTNRTNAPNQPNPPGHTDSRSLASVAQPADRSDRPAGREVALPASERTDPPSVSVRARVAQPASQRTETTAVALLPRRTTPRGEMMDQGSDVDVVGTVPACQGSQIASSSFYSGRLLTRRAELSNVRIERTAAQDSLTRSRILGEELVDQREYVPIPQIPLPRESSRQTELLPRFGSGPGPPPRPRAPTASELFHRRTERASTEITALDIALTYARTGGPIMPFRPPGRVFQSESLDSDPRRGDTVTEVGDSRARRVGPTGWTSNLWRALRDQGGSVERPETLNEVESQPLKIRFQILFPARGATITEFRPEDVMYEIMARIIADHNAAIPNHHARMEPFRASNPDAWALRHQTLGPEPGIGESVPFPLL